MYDNVKINLEVISPIFIGTGGEYSRSNFCFGDYNTEEHDENILKTKKLVRLDIDKVAKFIYKSDEKLFEEFIDIISNTRSFKNIKTKKNKNKPNPPSLHEFIWSKIKKENPDLFRKIISSYSYKCSLGYGGSIIKLKENGKKGRFALNNLESSDDIGLVKEHVKTNNELFIPGSSIKGAIRNTLLYSTLNLNNVENKDIKYTVNRKHNSMNNAMKYLHFSDTFNTVKEPCIYGVESIGTRRNTFSFIETIDKGNNLEFEYYNAFNNKIHNSRDLTNLELSIESIFKSIYKFSKDLIDHEMRFIDDELYSNSMYSEVDAGKIDNYYLNLKDKNKPDSPLLRLGSGSGALAMSQLLEIKNSRESLKQFTSFRRNERVGKKYKTFVESNYNYPKTRKLIVNTYEPLGWVKLNILEE